MDIINLNDERKKLEGIDIKIEIAENETTTEAYTKHLQHMIDMADKGVNAFLTIVMTSEYVIEYGETMSQTEALVMLGALELVKRQIINTHLSEKPK